MSGTIACVYPDGCLTGSWFQFSQRLKATVRRGGLDGAVELVPVSALQPGYDVIVAQPPAGDEARAAGAEYNTPIVEIQPADLDQLGELMTWLVTEAGWQRRKIGREVAVHRGFQQVGWKRRERARQG